MCPDVRARAMGTADEVLRVRTHAITLQPASDENFSHLNFYTPVKVRFISYENGLNCYNDLGAN